MKKTILLALMLGCSVFSDEASDIYYIEQGEHQDSRFSIPSPIFSERYDIVFTFNELHLYSDELQTSDINKLYGITSPKIHQNSARFGWRNIQDDEIEIFAYWYKDGVRGFELIGTTKPKEQNHYSIDVTGHRYVWCFQDIEYVVEGTKNIATFKAYPYFGGDNPAPHYMYFKINELWN